VHMAGTPPLNHESLRRFKSLDAAAAVKIAHVTSEQVSPRCTVPYSSLHLLKILFSVFGNCWSWTSCLINVCFSSKNRPSVRRASAANAVCTDVDVFGAASVFISPVL
jgi:hypothetical protein